MIRTGTLQITPESLNLIAGLDEFKGAWQALRTLAPERLSALRRVATIESIGSSTRIEGSKLSDREVERLLSNLEIKSFATRDEQEVAGYAETMDGLPVLGRNHAHRKPRQATASRYAPIQRKRRASSRNYKTQPNNVAAFDEAGKQVGIVFETASPFDTPRRMSELIAWTSDAYSSRQLHPLLVTAIFTVVLLEIHPFQDGNGRLSRILTTLLLLRAGYSYVPYSSLESVIEQSKEGYYLALRQTQVTVRKDAPNWQPWVMFFLRALQQQMKHLAKKMEREKIVLAALPELSVRIIEHVREHGRVTISDIVRLTGTSRNTLKQHFRQLVAEGHLALHGSGRGAWYALP